jgi:hypothetical protein
MPYTHVLIYTPEGECLGYGIRKPAPALQLKSVNIWTEEEQGDVQEQLNRLNADVSLRTHWPKLDDPEVQALLNDPTWMPLEMEEVTEVDDENSYYAYKTYDHGDGPRQVIDEDATVLAYHPPRLVPKRPIEAQVRIKKTQERVAHDRTIQ